MKTTKPINLVLPTDRFAFAVLPAPDVKVADGQEILLTAGTFGFVLVKNGGTLRVAGDGTVKIHTLEVEPLARCFGPAGMGPAFAKVNTLRTAEMMPKKRAKALVAATFGSRKRRARRATR